ncbi:hypothetical protein Tco_0541390 [Tanacetum coccineum]
MAAPRTTHSPPYTTLITFTPSSPPSRHHCHSSRCLPMAAAVHHHRHHHLHHLIPRTTTSLPPSQSLQPHLVSHPTPLALPSAIAARACRLIIRACLAAGSITHPGCLFCGITARKECWVS